MIIVRRLWFKLLLASLGASVAALWAFVSPPTSWIRDHLTAALQGKLFVLGLASAMALFLLGNFVRGLCSNTFSLIADIRKSLWAIHDDLSASSDSAVRAVLNHHIGPLLGLSREQWLQPGNYHGWSQDIATTMSKCRSIKQRSLILQP